MVLVLKDIRDLSFDNLDDPSSPAYSEEAERRMAERRRRIANAKQDEKDKEEAKIRRESKIKQNLESDEAPEVINKREERSMDKEESFEEIGGCFGMEDPGEGKASDEVPFRSLPSN